MSHGNINNVTQIGSKVKSKKPTIVDPATGEELQMYDPWDRINSSRMYSQERLHQDRLKDLSARRRKLIDLDPTTREAQLLTVAGAWEAGQLRKQFNAVRESAHVELQRKAKAKQLKAEQEDTDKRYNSIYKDVAGKVQRDNPGKKLHQIPEEVFQKAQTEFTAETIFKEDKKRIKAKLKEEETLRVKQEEGESKTHREILDALIEKHGVENMFAGKDKSAFADKYHNYRGGLEQTIERIAHSDAGLASKDVNLKKVLGELKGAGYGITGQLSSIVNFSKIGDDIDNLKKKLQGKELTGEDRRKTKNIVNLLERTRDALEKSIDKTLKKGVIVRRKDRFKGYDPIADLEKEVVDSARGVEEKLQSGKFLDELEGMRSKPIEGLDWLGYPELQTKLDFDDRDAFINAQAQKLKSLTPDRTEQLSSLMETKPTAQVVTTNPASGAVMSPSGEITGLTTNIEELNLDDSILNTGDGSGTDVGEATGGLHQELGINNTVLKQMILESHTFDGMPQDVSHFELATITKLEAGGTNNSSKTIHDDGKGMGAFGSLITTAAETELGQGKSLEQIKRELQDPKLSTIYAGQILSSIKADLSSSPHYKNLSPREQSALALFAYNAGITRTKTLLQITKATSLRDVLDFKGNIIIQGKKRQGVPSISKRYGQRAFKHLKNLDEVNRVKKKAEKPSGRPTVDIDKSPTRESFRQDIQPRSPQKIDTEVPERVPIESGRRLPPSNVTPREIQIPSGDDEVQRITLAQEQRRFKDAYDARMEIANRTIEKFLAAGASPAQIEMAKLHLIDMKNASEWMDRHPTAPKFQEAFQSFIKAMKEIVIYKEQ